MVDKLAIAEDATLGSLSKIIMSYSRDKPLLFEYVQSPVDVSGIEFGTLLTVKFYV